MTPQTILGLKFWAIWVVGYALGAFMQEYHPIWKSRRRKEGT